MGFLCEFKQAALVSTSPFPCPERGILLQGYIREHLNSTLIGTEKSSCLWTPVLTRNGFCIPALCLPSPSYGGTGSLKGCSWMFRARFLTCPLLCSTCLWTLPACLCSRSIFLLVLVPPSVLAFCGLFWCSPCFFQPPSHGHWPYSGVRTLLTRPVRSSTQQRRGISIPWEAAQCRDSPIQHQSCQLWDWEEHWHLSAVQHLTHLPVGPCEQPSCTHSLGQSLCTAAQRVQPQPVQGCLTRHCLHSLWIQPMWAPCWHANAVGRKYWSWREMSEQMLYSNNFHPNSPGKVWIESPDPDPI